MGLKWKKKVLITPSFFEASQAIDTLSFQEDRELVRGALEIVRNTMRAGLDGAEGGRDMC